MHENSLPLVSIIINNYNYEKYVGVAIESALNQSYQNIEVIVVDDGSTDRSREVIQKYKNSVKVVYKDNLGQSSALNCGFENSKGDIILLLDSDDIFLKEKVSTIVDVFNSKPDIDWCFHLLKCINLNFNFNSEIPNNPNLNSIDWDKREEILKKGKLSYIDSATSGLCFRRTLLNKIFPLPESIKITSDNYLKFSASALGKAFFLSHELSIQTLHGNNAYTLRENNEVIRAEVLILTAYWLRVRFPKLAKFANGLFLLGVKTVLASNSKKVDHADIIKRYYKSTNLFETIKMKCNLIVFKFKLYRNFSKT